MTRKPDQSDSASNVPVHRAAEPERGLWTADAPTAAGASEIDANAAAAELESPDIPDEPISHEFSPQALPTLSELVELYYADVYRFAFRLAGNQADAEDLTQRTYLTACQKFQQVRDVAKIRAWLFTITRHTFLKTIVGAEPPLTGFEQTLDSVVESDSGTFDFDEELLQQALQEMPEAYRTPLLLFYFEEMPYKEIAESLGLPLGTVMSRLSRGKAYLRSRLATDTQHVNLNSGEESS